MEKYVIQVFQMHLNIPLNFYHTISNCDFVPRYASQKSANVMFLCVGALLKICIKLLITFFPFVLNCINILRLNGIITAN